MCEFRLMTNIDLLIWVGGRGNLKQGGIRFMQDVFLSMVSGLLVGGLFYVLNLPIPAPPNLAGVMGIVGIYLGFYLASILL